MNFVIPDVPGVTFFTEIEDFRGIGLSESTRFPEVLVSPTVGANVGGRVSKNLDKIP
jgi:hypothetical protein